MGTVMRVGFAVAGLLCLLFGIGLIAPSLIGLLASGDEVDFPGGIFGVMPLIILSGVAPLALGAIFLRKAFERAPAASKIDAGSQPVGPTEAHSVCG